MATFGGLAAISSVPAFANATTANYTIGAPTGAVTAVTVSPTNVVAAAIGQSFTMTFVTPAALSNSAGDSITVADDVSNAVTDTVTTASVDLISGSCIQSGDTTLSGGAFVVAISSGCGSIVAGATVELTFSVNDPASSTSSFYFEVSTSENGTTADSPTITNSAAPPTLSANTSQAGAGAVYTIEDVGGSTTTGWGSLSTSASVIELDSPTGIAWYTSGTAGYSATYTPKNGTAAADTVEGIYSPSANIVDLFLNTAVAAGGTLNITAEGSNPTPTAPATSETVDVELTPGNCVSAGTNVNCSATVPFTAVPTGGPMETTGTVTIGTVVTSPTVSVSPLVGDDTATYVVSFKATNGIPTSVTPADDDIVISETSGPTNFSTATGVLVTDSTAGWHFVATNLWNTALVPPACGAATAGDFCGTTGGDLTIYLPGGDVAASGDAITVTAVNVTNPGNGTYSDFDVSDSQDAVTVAVPSYILSASGTASPHVVVSPSTTGAVATYTLTGLYASAAITASSTSYELQILVPGGTVLPDVAGDYTLTDSTTASGSGTFALEDYNAADEVTLEFPEAVNSGDVLTVTVSDVINPASSSSTDSISLTGDVSGQTGIAPFPDANVSYPNGSIVDFAGTFYAFAGGHPFGIASGTVLAKLQSVDKAVVLKATVGSLLPSTAPRPGTLITTNAVNSNATIYVVGNDGELHGFATGAQFLGDGYDPALTVTVPSLGGLTVGSTAGVEGSAVTALATSADGAIVDSANTYYVFDGSKAFGIPTPAALQTVRKTDSATALTGTVTSAQTGATFASGALLTQAGIVYVGYVSDIFPFKAQSQLAADGYAGTASVTVPNLGGLAVVSTYSGS